MLLFAIEDRLAGQWEPVTIPACAVAPERGPDVIVEADDEQVEVARCARYCRDVLSVAIEHGLPGERKPVGVPAYPALPASGPDMIVETDDEQIEIARRT